MLKKIDQLEKEWEIQKTIIERKNKIKLEKFTIRSNFINKLGTKPLVAFLFLNCTLLELFTCGILLWSLYLSVITGIPADLSPLTTLISLVVGEVVTFAVYAYKSAKENTKGGIIYDKAMKDFEDDSDLAEKEKYNG